MADVRISQLSNALPLSGGEYIPITQMGINGKLQTVYTTPETIASYVIARAAAASAATAVTSTDAIPVITPAGAVLPFAGDIGNLNNIPTGWLVCDGTAVSKTQYAILYTVIGDKWGTTTDSTLFKLPDLRFRTILGYNSPASTATPAFGNWSGGALALGQTGGEFTHRITSSEMPAHTHNYYDAYGAGDDNGPDFVDIDGRKLAGFQEWWSPRGTAYQPSGVDDVGDHALAEVHRTSEASGGNGYHNNMQPFICMNYIIKY